MPDPLDAMLVEDSGGSDGFTTDDGGGGGLEADARKDEETKLSRETAQLNFLAASSVGITALLIAMSMIWGSGALTGGDGDE